MFKQWLAKRKINMLLHDDVERRPREHFPIGYAEFSRFLELKQDKWFCPLPANVVGCSWYDCCPLALGIDGTISGVTWNKWSWWRFRWRRGIIPQWAREFVTAIDAIVDQWQNPSAGGDNGIYGRDALAILKQIEPNEAPCDYAIGHNLQVINGTLMIK